MEVKICRFTPVILAVVGRKALAAAPERDEIPEGGFILFDCMATFAVLAMVKQIIYDVETLRD